MGIRVLDNQLIDQIAAGEVVERPASVVKELVENAIDAHSRHINVHLEEGGLSKIEIADDGDGMTEEEILLAFLRHATSKIRSEEDLHNLKTLGFRGEALPSIASVSKVKLLSCTKDLGGGYVLLEGGDVKDKGKFTGGKGTRIIVSDLFYNTPARRKFMKTATSEFQKIHDIMVKLALSRTDISFSLFHNGKSYFKTPGSSRLNETVASLWGRDFLNCFIPVSWCGETTKVEGFISRPEYKRGNRSRQLFFVNGRVVQNPMFSRAVDEGYKGLLITKEFAATILYIDVNGQDVDCNVHPQKMQVRFLDEGKIFQSIKQTIRENLGSFNHQIGFNDYAEKFVSQGKEVQNLPFSGKTSANLMTSNNINFYNDSVSIDETINDYSNHPYPPIGESLSDWEEEITRQNFSVQNNMSSDQDFTSFLPMSNSSINYRIIGQVFNGYLILEVDDSIWIVDQHAAHERLNYNTILEKMRDDLPVTQMLVIPQYLELTPRDVDLYYEKENDLKKLGFIIEPLGEKTLVLRGVPEICAKTWMNSLDTVESLNEIISRPTLEKMAASLACKKSVRDHQIMSKEEIETLISQWIKTPDFRHCPHGRPTFMEITHDELERKFKRD